jgi:sugar-specific transcriptional regulator TrmB
LISEQLLRVLVSLGIRRLDAEVYLHLATWGPKKGRTISNELKINRQQLYRSLKNLKTKGLVKASLEHPAIFTAITIEDAFDSIRETKLEEAQSIIEKKDELLSRWEAVIKKENSEKTSESTNRHHNLSYSSSLEGHNGIPQNQRPTTCPKSSR